MLASSSDEEAVILDSDTSEKNEVGSIREKKANGRTAGSKTATRPGLLSMKLSETETSEDEKKYR